MLDLGLLPPPPEHLFTYFELMSLEGEAYALALIGIKVCDDKNHCVLLAQLSLFTFTCSPFSSENATSCWKPTKNEI